MSYTLNKTDGTLLTELIDGEIDSASTNLILVGRNYTGFGEFLNENFIKLLENFANTAAPSNPLNGQLWWNTTEQRLKVWDGQQWKASGGPFVQDTTPQMVAGDLWIDNLNNQLYFYDGTDLTLVGPQFTALQGTSGFRIDSILDEQNRSRPVAKLFVADELVGLFSNIEFTPLFNERIDGLVTPTNPNGIIKKGFNILDQTDFKIHGTATSSNALVTDTGAVVTANQFLRSDGNSVTVGTIEIQNSGGLTIGLSKNNVQKVVSNNFFIENQIRDDNLSLRVRSTAFASLITDGVFIQAEDARVGIFNNAPEAMLHIGSSSNPGDIPQDVIIEGNLTVRGSTTNIDVSTLRVADKNIELGIPSDSSALDNVGIDNGGIILKSLDDDKEFLWKNATNSWTSSVNIDLKQNNSYKINGVAKLSENRLESSILFANGLVQVGTLQFLNVDQINIDNSAINSVAPLSINSAGTITINDQKITGVLDPTSPGDVANKNYVDKVVDSERILLSLDTTGLSTNQIAYIIDSIFPASEKELNASAFIVTQTLSGSQASNIDVDSVKNVSFVAVDSNGTQNESVVQDIAFFPAQGTVTVSITRGLKRFAVEIVDSVKTWVFKSDIYDDYTTAPGWPS